MESCPQYVVLFLSRPKNGTAKGALPSGRVVKGVIPMARMIDLTGQHFGQLTAIKPTDERRNRTVIWECKCDCGNTTFVKSSALRSGGITSCGCARGRKGADFTGQRFGRLTAIRPTDERRHGAIVWECKCDCGNTTYVSTSDLTPGGVTSCGCAKWKDLTGQRFGRLTAIRPTDERRNRTVVWECNCDCGNTAFVRGSTLRSGGTQSCGCLKSKRGCKAKGERI